MTIQMIQTTLWFIIILFSQVFFIRIVNFNKLKLIFVLCGVAYSIILAVLFHITRLVLPHSRVVLLILVLAVFEWKVTKTKPYIALMACILSVGISFGLFLISTLISSLVLVALLKTPNELFVLFLSVIVQCICSIILFRIKRFQKGILFLHKKKTSALGVVLCGAIIVIISIIQNQVSAETGAFLLAGVGLCLMGLFFWWHTGLSSLYKERLWNRNIDEYEKEMAEKDKLIRKLQEDNEAMAKIIHRDNKLLPALRNSILQIAEDGIISKSNSERLTNHVEELLEERTCVINHITFMNDDSREMPGSNIFNDVLQYMGDVASKKGILYKASVEDGFAGLIENTISAMDLKTLCADLIENAIIATTYSEHKQILISFGINRGLCEICVCDSGIPFELDTLINLGKKKCSTHIDEGGSGYGYLAIFKILRKYNASIVITEHIGKTKKDFLKSIKILFDNKNAYIIRTHRERMLQEAFGQGNLPENFPTVMKV